MVTKASKKQLDQLKSKNQDKKNKILKTIENNGFNYFFDKKSFFWFWNKDEYKYEIVDDVDILNYYHEFTGGDIITPKNRSLVLNILKQEGRKRIPKEISKYSIQFKEKIYDIENDRFINSSPRYFITNPLKYKIGDSTDTPTIDKFFDEWVGGEYKENLYEIIAYCCCQEQFMQRIIALCGAGSNGKGTFLNLTKKFLGNENCCSSTIKAFSTRNFESSATYKKLVCFFGEADSSDLSNTNLIKSLTGEDLIRYEFKNKTTFSEESITTPILATNSLPITPDKSDGFYRRFLILDFPNQFPIKRDLLKEIPYEEFENLSLKIIETLKKLYKSQEFLNEGDIEYRRKRYEERSNPIISFISEFFDEDGTGKIRLRDFFKSFNKHLRQKKLRSLTISKIGKHLRDEGFEIQARDFKEGDKAKAIIGLSSKKDGQSIEENSSLSSCMEKSKLLELPNSTIDHISPKFKALKNTEFVLLNGSNFEIKEGNIYDIDDLGESSEKIIRPLINDKFIQLLEVKIK